MKPSAFTYHAPKTLDEALDLMATLDNARVLAGGQSLMPMMNYRVVQPGHLIDLGRIPELAFVVDTPEGLKVGAMTTQRSIERSALVRERCPLLIDALFHVGHQQTRNRGTIGGSICHLDPAAELPVTACALDAVMTVASKNGRRKIPFADFAAGYLTSSLGPNEIVIAIDFGPYLGSRPERAGSAFEEYAVRPADFAIVSVAAVIAMNEDDVISDARVAAGGIAAVPIRLTGVEEMLKRQRPGADLIERVAATAAALPAEGDDANPAEYRQELAGHLTQRALRKAIQRVRA
ncbi:MAG TPA: xanthine dehydrogenase family protein subunit M [Xanthobacteraceae bacterium]|jgi:carbon-monoxide dehydrogenase medium subunit|nr:xanthine dehydrogenase family protein subunit M [Xanthobacteraceae bacterium]